MTCIGKRAPPRRLGDAAAYPYAEINATPGDRDKAFRWLEVARKIRDPGLSILLTEITAAG